MEPKETQSYHQSQTPNLNQTSEQSFKTVNVGVDPLPPSSPGSKNNEQPGFWEGLRLPLKRTAIVVGGLFLIAIILSGLLNLLKGIFEGISKPKPIASAPPIEQPTIKPTPTITPTTTSSPENKCLDLPAKMAQAKINSKQVDKIFYQNHPERVKTPISPTDAADRPLRQEWCGIANQLIEGSTPKQP
jgi:hypothetical protein